MAARSGIWSPLAPLLRPGYRQEAMALLGRFGLEEVADARADALNEGARKLADIAMAVALEPRLLLMDEPTSGVAAAEKMGVVETLVRVLREAGVTAVFVEHDMEVVARFADRVAAMLAIEGGSVDIAGVPVLREVRLRVPPGGRVALIGRNGAGKTTTLRALMGLLPLRLGRVAIDGRDATEMPAPSSAWV